MSGKSLIASAIAFGVALMVASGGAQAHKPKHIKVLESFCSDPGCKSGYNSAGRLAMDANGNFFGFTGQGGVYGNGTAFMLHRDSAKSKWKFQTIYNFCSGCGTIGGPSTGTPVVDTAGNIYGLSYAGGTNGFGTFFELSPSPQGKLWTLGVHYSFCTKDNGCHDGGQPFGSLTYQGAASGALYDGASPLYGVNELGGAHGDGVVFSLARRFGFWREHVLYPLCSQGGTSCADGQVIFSLSVDQGGNLVGPGKRTYPDPGFVVRLSPNPGGRFWTESILYNFCSLANCADGSDPAGGLAQDASGNLYGLTNYGGVTNCGYSGGCGVLYRIAPDNSETVLHEFCSRRNCADGAFPGGDLLIDASGTLFGVTGGGGHYKDIHDTFGTGIVFKFNGALRTLWTFCLTTGCPDGANPVQGPTADSSGDLFGLTAQGGADQDGAIFELNQ